MKEYGNAIEMEYPAEVAPADVVDKARNILDFNYQATKKEHPDWPLPETYELVVGAIHPVWEYEDCPVCQGRMYYGDLEWECVSCDMGKVPYRLAEPPRWKHTFGWYVKVE